MKAFTVTNATSARLAAGRNFSNSTEVAGDTKMTAQFPTLKATKAQCRHRIHSVSTPRRGQQSGTLISKRVAENEYFPRLTWPSSRRNAVCRNSVDGSVTVTTRPEQVCAAFVRVGTV